MLMADQSTIESFCYATADAAVTYGQAFIIGGGLIVGLTLAARYRFKTRNKKYVSDAGI